jgi:hypothetical protein
VVAWDMRDCGGDHAARRLASQIHRAPAIRALAGCPEAATTRAIATVSTMVAEPGGTTGRGRNRPRIRYLRRCCSAAYRRSGAG